MVFKLYYSTISFKHKESLLFTTLQKLFGFHKNNEKLDLSDLKQPYPDNVHRSGWNGAVEALNVLHRAGGVKLDNYMDETFDWGDKSNLPYTDPWIGFLHFPNTLPDWHPDGGRNDIVFNNSLFQESLKSCQGIFTLSRYHRDEIAKRTNVPVNNLFLSTEFPQLTWSAERFRLNPKKKIVQLGFFMRNMHAIYLLPETKYHKLLLRPNNDKIDSYMALEKEHTLKDVQINYKSVEQLSFISNDEYDLLLSENVAMCYLYNASANNVLVECIARNTPLLVNPIASVVEYLGEEYPLYFNTLEEAAMKLENEALIYQTHLYLKSHPFKEKFSYNYFVQSLKNSEIYKNL